MESLIVTFPRETKETSENSLIEKCRGVGEFLRSHGRLLRGNHLPSEVKVSRSSRKDTTQLIAADLFEDPFAEAIFPIELNGKDDRDEEDILEEIFRSWCSYDMQIDMWLSIRRPNENIVKYKRTASKIPLETLSFGVTIGILDFLPEAVFPSNVKSSGFIGFEALFDHLAKRIIIGFSYKHACETFRDMEYNVEIEVNYSTIARTTVNLGRGVAELFLRLQQVPLVYRTEELSINKNCCYRTNIMGCELKNCGAKFETRLMAVSNTIKLEMKLEKDNFPRYLLQQVGQEQFFGNMRTMGAIPKERKRKIFKEMEVFLGTDEKYFRSAYAIQACRNISLDFDRQMAIMTDPDLEGFLRELRNAMRESMKIFEKTMFRLSEAVDKGNVVTYRKAIFELIKRFLLEERSKSVLTEPRTNGSETMQGSRILYKIFITPSRLILRPPSEHGDNRVLRQFDPDFMLRVAFRDDNLSLLSNTVRRAEGAESFLNSTIKVYLEEGLKLINRTYEFLAASSSQLRDHGCWFYAPDREGRTSQHIVEKIGKFDDISSVGKRMARQGQCFSTTTETVQVAESEFSAEADVEGGEHPVSHKAFTFSDGIGRISSQLRDDVCQALDESLKGRKPSAFQIRFRGAKGVVAIDPGLEGRQLVLRDSMIKFWCDSSDSLEVIKYSEERNVTLNRPLITILDQLGISSDIFLQYQAKNIFDFSDSLLVENLAAERLKAFVRAEPGHYFSYEDFSENGMSLVRDPYFRSILLALYGNIIGNLRSKARISIPWTLGRNLLGVMDETGRLEYGQVYIRYTVREDDSDESFRTADERSGSCTRSTTLVGKVMVTKCPCHHPGDVRMLNAVDIPELSHLVDVIVFPQKGKRPHPNEMAGSDLDGDEYIAIWDERFFFKCACGVCQGKSQDGNHEPMIFADVEPKREGEKQDKIKKTDFYDFFCDYILSDQKGKISNAHLVWADLEGIFSPKCEELARKISTCLDFAKTGRRTELDKTEIPQQYPDFMEKQNHKHTYRSNRALGHLFRACKVAEDSLMSNALSIAGLKSSSYVDRTFIMPDIPECIREEAVRLVEAYDWKLRKIMRNTGVRTEAEIMSGLVLTTGKYQSSNFHDIEELQESLQRQRCFLSKQMREDFDKFIKSLNGCGVDEISEIQLASACYSIVYQPKKGDPGTPFKGLPWIFADKLLECKNLHLLEKPDLIIIPSCSMADEITTLIQRSYPEDQNTTTKIYMFLMEWSAREGILYEKICASSLLKVLSLSGKSPTTLWYGDNPGDRILRFFRYCATTMFKELGQLDCGSCLIGKKDTAVCQEISRKAMKLYSDLAVTGDVMIILGLSRSPAEGTPGSKNMITENETSFILNVREFRNMEFISDHQKLILNVFRGWCNAERDEEIHMVVENRTIPTKIRILMRAREQTCSKLEAKVLSYGLEHEDKFIEELRDELEAVHNAD